MRFTVAHGKISYIGHIKLPFRSEKRDAIRVVLIGDPTVADRSEEARTWLAANQPSLQQNYEFVDALALSGVRENANSSPTGTTEFQVILKLLVAVDGSVKDWHIAKSSGQPSLDKAALEEAMRSWKAKPQLEGGHAVEKWMNFSVTYRLTK